MTTENHLSLKTFIPGTKAKAEEVNANFSILKNAIMEKADASGDSAQTFEVANAVEDSQAVNKAQLNALKMELTTLFSKFGYRFCIRKGNTTDGEGDLFDFENMIVTPKIGGAYSNLIVSDYIGNTYEMTSAEPFSMRGKTDGTYNIFINPEGTLYTLKNKIYIQKSRPELVDGDVWLDTSCEPMRCILYTNNTDFDFNDIPLGEIVIEESQITSVTTRPFITNGYDITHNNLPSYKYDYGNPINLSFGQRYTAQCDGLLHVQGGAIKTDCYVIIEENDYLVHYSGSYDSLSASFIPLAKGQVFWASAGSRFRFIPKVAC